MTKGKQLRAKDIVSKIGTCIALIVMFVIFSIATPKFLQYDNLMNVLKQTSINALISSGMLIVLITAGIDLSVGAVCALSSCIMGLALQAGVTNSALLILICLLTGGLVGAFNGFLLTKLHLPHPFVSTLGTRNIARGLALFLTGAATIGNFPDGVLALGFETIEGFPVSFLAVLILFVCYHFFLNKTALGRQIYCIGGNAEAARLSGIRSDRVLMICYILSGLMAALAGVILVGRTATAYPLAGDTYDTDAIAACIIGGASFMGGKGTIWGTLIGAMLIAIIRNGLNLLGASSYLQQIVLGAVIILAVFVDVTRERMESKARRLAAK